MRRLASVTALSLLVFSSTLDGQSAAPAPAAKDRHVILISLDGFPAVALDNPRTPVPTLHRLVREGARAAAVVPVNPVVTWPNHTTYVTGVTPADASGDVQRPAHARRLGPPEDRAVASEARDGEGANGVRRCLCGGAHDGPGGLGGDSRARDDHMGVCGTPGPRRRRRNRDGRRGPGHGGRHRDVQQGHGRRLARPGVDRRRGAHPGASQAEPVALPPARTRQHAPHLRPGHAGVDHRHGLSRCAGRPAPGGARSQRPGRHRPRSSCWPIMGSGRRAAPSTPTSRCETRG